MLDIACGKSGHSSALLNVNWTFQFLECRVLYLTVTVKITNRNRDFANCYTIMFSPIKCRWSGSTMKSCICEVTWVRLEYKKRKADWAREGTLSKPQGNFCVAADVHNYYFLMLIYIGVLTLIWTHTNAILSTLYASKLQKRSKNITCYILWELVPVLVRGDLWFPPAQHNTCTCIQEARAVVMEAL